MFPPQGDNQTAMTIRHLYERASETRKARTGSIPEFGVTVKIEVPSHWVYVTITGTKPPKDTLLIQVINKIGIPLTHATRNPDKGVLSYTNGSGKEEWQLSYQWDQDVVD